MSPAGHHIRRTNLEVEVEVQEDANKTFEAELSVFGVSILTAHADTAGAALREAQERFAKSLRKICEEQSDD